VGDASWEAAYSHQLSFVEIGRWRMAGVGCLSPCSSTAIFCISYYGDADRSSETTPMFAPC
jgi:hypothetical protein